MTHFKLSRFSNLKHPLVLILLACALASTANAAGKNLNSLSAPARDLALTTMAFTDELWDERAGLCWLPQARSYGKRHGVRETAWYAVGLLLRNRPGDLPRAIRALNAVLDNQFDEPDRDYHGTFARAPEDPRPNEKSRIQQEYDANWRQMTGTTFPIILEEYQERLPKPLVSRIEQSLSKAAAGEERHKRLGASYTNISLLHAFLLDYTGARLKQPEWTRRGIELAEQVYALFQRNQTFNEFNAPTYYGVDLWALALWRARAPSARLRELGTEMETALWRDIARFYHAGLRNLSGPFTRTYGMDMPHYVNITGMWFWESLGREFAPFPKPDEPEIRTTSQDFMWGSCVAIVGTKIPPDALPHLKAFQGERQVERLIGSKPQFLATAWFGEALMLGAEETSGTRGAGGQFIPATAYWRTPDGGNGWFRLAKSSPVDARATKETLTISCAGDTVFEVRASGLNLKLIQKDRWSLPGLVVDIETDAKEFSVSQGERYPEVVYRGATKYIFRTRTAN